MILGTLRQAVLPSTYLGTDANIQAKRLGYISPIKEIILYSSKSLSI
jgi:hypothetical protein